MEDNSLCEKCRNALGPWTADHMSRTDQIIVKGIEHLREQLNASDAKRLKLERVIRDYLAWRKPDGVGELEEIVERMKGMVER